MLKFLQNKSSNRLTAKPLVKYQPQMVYGHTLESPNQFVNRHTIYFNSTESSSFLKKAQIGELPVVQNNPKKSFKSGLRHESQHFNINSQHRKTQSRERSMNIQRGADEETNGDFNKTRGQFSSFLDKHKHYGCLGTIHKENQSNFLATHTKSAHKFNWNRSNHTQSKGLQTSTNIKSKMSLPSQTIEADRSLLNQSKNSTLGITRSNSVSVFEKIAKKSELKLRRDEYIEQIRKETKDKLDKKYETFGLPRIGVQHELFLLEKTKVPKRQTKTELQQMNSDISKFESSLYYKLK